MEKLLVSMCEGCCCGHPEKGNPNVLLKEFSVMLQEANLKHVSLSVPYCLGPCGMANVVKVQVEGEDFWFGKMNNKEDIEALAEFVKNPSSLPPSLSKKRFRV